MSNFFPIDVDVYEGDICGDLIVRCTRHPEDDALLLGFDEVGEMPPSCGCGFAHAQYGMTESPCEGHESTAGAIGESTFCDGTCVAGVRS